MGSFLKKLFKFLLPLIFFVVVVYAAPISRKFAYGFINKGGCEYRSAWIHHLVFEDTAAIDVAFIGTSHTMCAMNDAWMEQQINDSLHSHLHFRNLAYCGYERNLNYVMARDIFQQKKPKVMVVEVRENESQSSHIYFGNIATTADLFTAPIAWNRYYLRDLYMGFIFRLQHLREVLTGEAGNHHVDIPASPYGFNGGDRLADPAIMFDHDTRKRNAAFIEKGVDGVDLEYMDRIATLAKENNTTIVMVYLPLYAQAHKKTGVIERYSAYGKIIFPPQEILDDKANWQDEGHLNNRGASLVSACVKDELLKTITGAGTK